MKNKIILIGIGIIATETIRALQEKHPNADIIVRTPEEHEEAEKQRMMFERPPMKFELTDLFIPEPKLVDSIKKSPIDAIAKPNRFGKHRHW